MNYLDIVIIGITALLVFNGVRKGFIISLATFVAFFLGIWIAIHFSDIITVFLKKTFHTTGAWLPPTSFTITVSLVIILVLLLAKGLEKLVSLAGMGLLNHIAGGLFGLLKALIFVSVLFFIISRFDPKEKMITHKVREQSMFYRHIEHVFPYLMKITGAESRQLNLY